MYVSTNQKLAEAAGSPYLRELHAEKGVTEAGMRHLKGLFYLQRLDFHETPLKGDGLAHLARDRELLRISLFGCELSDEALSHLPPLPAVTMLNLGMTHVSDAALANLVRLPRLEELLLGQAHVTGPGLAALAPLKRLKSLDLHMSKITDDGLRFLSGLRRLEELDLSTTAVGDAGLAHLPVLPRLRHLRLEGLKITDEGVRHLVRCRSLESLNMNHTLITMAGFKQLKSALPDVRLTAGGTIAAKPVEEPLVLIERPEPRTAAPVARSWARIHAWLGRNAPKILATLRPPATEDELRQVEETIGQPLPRDVRESYLIHDGQNSTDDGEWAPGVFFGLRPRPLIEDEGVDWLWQHRTADSPEAFDEDGPEVQEFTCEPPETIRLARMRPGWIPLYWDSGRCFLGIDLDPGPRGITGQVIPFGWEWGIGGEEKCVIATSWGHFLEDVADELEAGHALIRPPEFCETWFQLRGAPQQWFWAAFPAWSRAKLPKAFRQTGGDE